MPQSGQSVDVERDTLVNLILEILGRGALSSSELGIEVRNSRSGALALVKRRWRTLKIFVQEELSDDVTVCSTQDGLSSTFVIKPKPTRSTYDLVTGELVVRVPEEYDDGASAPAASANVLGQGMQVSVNVDDSSGHAIKKARLRRTDLRVGMKPRAAGGEQPDTLIQGSTANASSAPVPPVSLVSRRRRNGTAGGGLPVLPKAERLPQPIDNAELILAPLRHASPHLDGIRGDAVATEIGHLNASHTEAPSSAENDNAQLPIPSHGADTCGRYEQRSLPKDVPSTKTIPPQRCSLNKDGPSATSAGAGHSGDSVHHQGAILEVVDRNGSGKDTDVEARIDVGASVDQVCAWLVLHNYKDYEDKFRENTIDGEMLKDLTDEDLASDFGLANKYHRRSLLKKFADSNKKKDAVAVGASVDEGLVRLNFGECEDKFCASKIDGEMLQGLTDEELAVDFNVTNKYHHGSLFHKRDKFADAKAPVEPLFAASAAITSMAPHSISRENEPRIVSTRSPRGRVQPDAQKKEERIIDQNKSTVEMTQPKNILEEQAIACHCRQQAEGGFHQGSLQKEGPVYQKADVRRMESADTVRRAGEECCASGGAGGGSRETQQVPDDDGERGGARDRQIEGDRFGKRDKDGNRDAGRDRDNDGASAKDKVSDRARANDRYTDRDEQCDRVRDPTFLHGSPVSPQKRGRSSSRGRAEDSVRVRDIQRDNQPERRRSKFRARERPSDMNEQRKCSDRGSCRGSRDRGSRNRDSRDSVSDRDRDRDSKDKDNKDKDSKDKDSRESVKEREGEDRGNKDRDSSDSVSHRERDKDKKDIDSKDTDSKDRDSKDTDSKNRDSKDRVSKDTDSKDTESKTGDSRDSAKRRRGSTSLSRSASRSGQRGNAAQQHGQEKTHMKEHRGGRDIPEPIPPRKSLTPLQKTPMSPRMRGLSPQKSPMRSVKRSTRGESHHTHAMTVRKEDLERKRARSPMDAAAAHGAGRRDSREHEQVKSSYIGRGLGSGANLVVLGNDDSKMGGMQGEQRSARTAGNTDDGTRAQTVSSETLDVMDTHNAAVLNTHDDTAIGGKRQRAAAKSAADSVLSRDHVDLLALVLAKFQNTACSSRSGRGEGACVRLPARWIIDKAKDMGMVQFSMITKIEDFCKNSCALRFIADHQGPEGSYVTLLEPLRVQCVADASIQGALAGLSGHGARHGAKASCPVSLEQSMSPADSCSTASARTLLHDMAPAAADAHTQKSTTRDATRHAVLRILEHAGGFVIGLDLASRIYRGYPGGRTAFMKREISVKRFIEQELSDQVQIAEYKDPKNEQAHSYCYKLHTTLCATKPARVTNDSVMERRAQACPAAPCEATLNAAAIQPSPAAHYSRISEQASAGAAGIRGRLPTAEDSKISVEKGVREVASSRRPTGVNVSVCGKFDDGGGAPGTSNCTSNCILPHQGGMKESITMSDASSRDHAVLPGTAARTLAPDASLQILTPSTQPPPDLRRSSATPDAPSNPPTPPTSLSRCAISVLFGAPSGITLEPHPPISQIRSLSLPLLWKGTLVWGTDGSAGKEHGVTEVYKADVHALHATGDDMELMLLVENALLRQSVWHVTASNLGASSTRLGTAVEGATGVCHECKSAGQTLVCVLTSRRGSSSVAGAEWWLDKAFVELDQRVAHGAADQGARRASNECPAEDNEGGGTKKDWAYDLKLAGDARVGALVVTQGSRLHQHLIGDCAEPLLVFWRR